MDCGDLSPGGGSGGGGGGGVAPSAALSPNHSRHFSSLTTTALTAHLTTSANLGPNALP